MKYILALSLIILSHLLGVAQNANSSNQQLNLNFGLSKHFSGDIPGIAFTTEYSKNFKKRISYSIGLTGTIHDSDDPLFFTSPSGTLIDGSIRYVTAGVQIVGHLAYHPVRTKHSDLQVKLGPLIRYQASSLPDVVDISYPPITGLPIPVIYFEQYEPRRIVTAGGSLQLRYDYTFNKKMTLGILGGFQIDTNEDNIAQVCLSVGRRF